MHLLFFNIINAISKIRNKRNIIQGNIQKNPRKNTQNISSKYAKMKDNDNNLSAYNRSSKCVCDKFYVATRNSCIFKNIIHNYNLRCKTDKSLSKPPLKLKNIHTDHFVLSQREIIKIKNKYNICGFINKKGTCYASAGLQILFACPKFINYLNSSKLCRINPLMQSLKTIAFKYTDSTTTQIDVTKVCTIYKEYICSDINGQNPLIFMLEIIHRLYKISTQKEINFLKKLFIIEYNITLNCSQCNNSLTKVEQKYSINFLCKTQLDRINTTNISDLVCLNCSCEIFKCVTEIKKGPKVLILNINQKIVDKNNKSKNFEIQEQLSFNNTKMRLFAYIMYIKQGKGRYHCICVIKKEGIWFMFSDENIIIVERYLLPKIYPSVLFYMKE